MSVRKRTWETPTGERKTAWVVDYRDQNGKRRLKTFTRKKDADSWQHGAAVEVGAGVHTPDSESKTVEEAAEIWLDACAAGRDGRDPVEPHTLRVYKQHVRQWIAPRIGAVKLSRLTTPAVAAFRDDLVRECRSRATARKVLGSFKAIINEAQARGLIAQNPARPISIVIASRHKDELVIPTRDHVRAILDAADQLAGRQDARQARSWRRWRAFLYTAALTGVRASELRGLPWRAVDLNGQTITIRQRADERGTIGPTKSAAGRRTIPISPALVSILREWRAACPPSDLGLVFPNGAGQPESLANVFNRCWLPALTAAGLADRYNFHTLRHFHASQLIASGANPKEVQTELGHSTIQMTFDVYGSLFPEDDAARQERAQRLADGLLS